MIACLYSQWVAIIPAGAGQLQQQNGVSGVSTIIGGCPIFPANNIWNTPIDNLPIHARSDQWVTTIGRNTGFHMDFGSGTWDGGPIGIPYNIVGGNIPKVSVSFYYPNLVFESSLFDKKIDRLVVPMQKFNQLQFPTHFNQYIGFGSGHRISISKILIKEVFVT